MRSVVYPGEKRGKGNSTENLDDSLRLLRWFDHYLVGAGDALPPNELDSGLEVKGAEAEAASQEDARSYSCLVTA